MNRPIRSIGKAGAAAQITVPRVKMVIVLKNNCLVVNHCNNNAEIGATIPIININPVVIHCTVGKVISNSFIKDVRAIFNNVSFNIAKKAPIISDNIMGNVLKFGSSARYSYFWCLLLFILRPSLS